MKKNIKNIILFIIFLLGLSIFLYPIISGYISYQNGLWKIKRYEQSVNDIPVEDYTAILEEAELYNRELFEYYDDVATKERYYNQLKIPNTDIMGYIYIKKLNINLPIYHSVDENVLQVGIGHLPSSSLPVGGESAHASLFGHRGLPTAKLFTNLDKMNIGDIFVLKILREKYYYAVDQVIVIEPNEVQKNLEIEENRDLVTLVTCTPYGINTQRLLIRGERTDAVFDDDLETILNKNYKNNILFIVAIIVVTIIVISGFITLIHEKNRKKHKFNLFRKPKRRNGKRGRREKC